MVVPWPVACIQLRAALAGSQRLHIAIALADAHVPGGGIMLS
jgi:hypothetical protein